MDIDACFIYDYFVCIYIYIYIYTHISIFIPINLDRYIYICTLGWTGYRQTIL